MISDIYRLYKSYKVSLYANFIGLVIYMRSGIYKSYMVSSYANFTW